MIGTQRSWTNSARRPDLIRLSCLWQILEYLSLIRSFNWLCLGPGLIIMSKFLLNTCEWIMMQMYNYERQQIFFQRLHGFAEWLIASCFDFVFFRLFQGFPLLVISWLLSLSINPLYFPPINIAQSNTSLRFFWVRAEHSIYSACILEASALVAVSDTGSSLYCANSMRTLTSFRKSHCVPIKTIGTLGLCIWSSGSHFSVTLLNDVGDTTLKQTRKTSVPG